MSTYEQLSKIAAELSKMSGSMKTLTDRRAAAFKALCRRFEIKYQYAGEKPHGKACAVVEMSDRWRVFIRCGYGKYNYAPCFEVLK